ncbi:MAG: acetyl-CoA carboxylase biotin carboxyl carrier protein [Brevinematia bacterium]
MLTIDEIKRLFKIFEGEDVGEIELRNKDRAIRMKLKRKEEKKKIEKPVEIKKEPQPETEKKPVEPPIYEVKSNWIGYFTRINPKTGENYVKLRDVVKKSDILGHVSVLGVLQDIKAEKGGKIKEILVEEGLAVEYGQPLMRIEVSEK